MNVLIIGSGGREHALAWKIKQSKFINELYIAPGNGGTAELGINVDIKEKEIDKLLKLAQEKDIDFVIVGPEVPLSAGIVDMMEKENILCFGPKKAAAKLEYSKQFAKEMMISAKVPTAKSVVCDTIADALAYIMQQKYPLVIKADGLAAGKGVIIAHNQKEAVDALELMFDGALGEAGHTVLIEEFLEGEEVSLLCFCDGEHALPLPSAQDHKAIGEGDKGLNTGGMGAYSPAPILPDDKLQEMSDLFIMPILREMKKRGTPFKGILYAGLMMTKNGIFVLEYNTRFGDPECQPLLMRLESDLIEILLACVKGTLNTQSIKIKKESALGVVLAAKGYPESYPKGMEIKGIDKAEATENLMVFQAGTLKTDQGLVSQGGRILCVTALGNTLAEAQKQAYAGLEKIQMDNGYFRRDIGNKGIAHIQKG